MPDTEARPLRVAVISEFPPPGAGLPVQARALSTALVEAGCEVVELRHNTRSRIAFVERLRGVRGLLRWMRFLRVLRRLPEVDVLHVLSGSGLNYHLFALPVLSEGRRRGVPVIINHHGGAAAGFFRRSRRARERTRREAAALVVPSAFLEHELKALGMAPQVIPNILDISRFDYRPPQLRPPRLLSARNLTPLYAVDTVLRAFVLVHHEHPDARLRIAGSGPERDTLKALARTLGVSDAVEFLGNVPNEEMPRHHAWADILLNASTVDNMPMSLLEAQASGCCVVSTRAGGIPWMVQDGETALLVPVGDETAMAEAALRLIRDPKLAATMAQRARQSVERLAPERVVPPWLALYRELRAAGKAGGALPKADQR